MDVISTHPDDSFIGAVPGRHWHALDDGRVQCDVCPRECKLQEGQRGLCFVRARHGNQVVLTTYGRSSGFCIDPVEKKPLNHFLPGTPILSFGTAGCNLTCKFCQNWDISKARSFDKLQEQASPEMIAEAAVRTGCKSVAFTYNDPVIFLEYAVDTAKACHARGVRTVAVTAGYIQGTALEDFFAHMDAANVDLKAFTEEFYHGLSTAHLAPILDTLVYLARHTKVWVELTTLVIPGHNDRPEEIDAMTRWVVDNLGPDVPMHFSAFHPDYRMADVPRTSLETLIRCREIALRNGVRFAYTGNVHHPDGDRTLCPSCGATLIERDWYVLKSYALSDDGHCLSCGALCAGVFDGPAGNWGAQRRPLRFR